MSYTPLGAFAVSGAGEAPLYSFSTSTFTNGGQTGRTGPSITQARNGLTGTGVDAWKNNTEFFNTSNGIQLWTVPETATYRITAIGARGGTSFTGYGGGQAGFGARMISDHALTRGTVIKILVGQMGENGGNNSCGVDGGGGGGTFVATSANVPLVVAGGGGGAGNHTRDSGGLRHAPNSQSGNAGSGSTSGSGGTNGDGGFVQSGSCVSGGASGAGFTGNGRLNGQSTAAFSFTNGGNGGAGGARVGGFGGGAASGTQYAAGGGGGYSGGGGGGLQTCSCSDMGNGGGGGSFSATSFTYSAQIGTGDGSVVIQKL
jgi:hypothetical protein